MDGFVPTWDLIFQPTLPARGATTRRRSQMERKNHFNPRSPHGERLVWCCALLMLRGISTHAPRTGSDLDDACIVDKRTISTHAPRTGSDPRK